ncbi:MAG: B12-binding domain-containing radical SAM protein [Sphaerochaetaceae bacterium]|nr:B12-binding domain-containing radical SAM protein [Sphaerochaetaceae bacterium]
MNITLISIAIEKSNLSYPLGALCIESSIKSDKELSKKTRVKTLLFDLENDPQVVAKEIAKSECNLVGLSIYLWNREWVDLFITALKEENKNILIYAGGSEVSANSNSFDLDTYRFLVAGEGEVATVEAIKKLINNEPLILKGVISKENPILSYPENIDLSTLSSPILTHVSDPFLYDDCSILWEMTRGCPFRCGFCFESKGLRSVRNYPFERIEKELDYIIEKGVSDVFVLDPTFNIDKTRTLKILHLIRDKAPFIHFTFEIRAELIDEDIADAFGEIFCSLQIGLQSIHSSVLKTVHRTFNRELFKEKITLLEKRNLVYGLDLIIGLPNDSVSLFKESLDFTVFCKPSNIDIFILSLLPGTKIYEETDKYKINFDHKSPYNFIESPYYSKDHINQALKIKRGCDYFYTKGGAVMFMKVLCDAFKMPPSSLFIEFNEFLDSNYESNFVDDVDIFELQDDFIRKMIEEKNVISLSKAILSYIELNQGLSYYLDVAQSPILSLWYEPNQLSQLEDISINVFVNLNEAFKQPKDYYIIGDPENIDIIECV